MPFIFTNTACSTNYAGLRFRFTRTANVNALLQQLYMVLAPYKPFYYSLSVVFCIGVLHNCTKKRRCEKTKSDTENLETNG